MIDYLVALFLGFVEGMTEFLPVSSTAHLLILTDFLNFKGPPGHSFEIFIQLGAIFAVVLLYFKKLWTTAINAPFDPAARHFIYCLLIGTVPAIIVGVLFHDFIKTSLYNPTVIATALCIGGVIILAFEKYKPAEGTISEIEKISLKTALLVGCCQAIAMIPGVSRSGASIIGGRALGLSRKAAAELSFFLAIPAMFAAVAYDTLKGWEEISKGGYFGLMLTGFTAAFITALIVIKAALWFISRYGFTPFGWYRIIAGLGIFAILYIA
jgi:undecaprenyl-diphosphatase